MEDDWHIIEVKEEKWGQKITLGFLQKKTKNQKNKDKVWNKVGREYTYTQANSKLTSVTFYKFHMFFKPNNTFKNGLR